MHLPVFNFWFAHDFSILQDSRRAETSVGLTAAWQLQSQQTCITFTVLLKTGLHL